MVSKQIVNSCDRSTFSHTMLPALFLSLFCYFSSWMADWQQQFLRHYKGLSCTDTVRVVSSLAVLHPPSTKLGEPITAALVDRCVGLGGEGW